MIKRVLALFLSLVLCLSLTGCSGLYVVKNLIEFVTGFHAEIIDLRQITADEAAKMDDYELCYDVLCLMAPESKEEFDALPHPQQVMYTVLWYQAEIENGGLSQFLFNMGSMVAPTLLDALNEVGADAYHDQLEEFATQNGIDLRDPTQFEFRSVDDYDWLDHLYDFDSFDDAFYELMESSPLEEPCAAYIRQHLSDFFE